MNAPRLAAAIAAPLAGFALAAGTVPAAGEVTVTVTDIRSADGVVRACITRDPASFPKCGKGEGSKGKVVAAGNQVTFTFRGLPPGRYAIALLHDENGNGKADRAAMMIPTEGFGFSRDAKVRMGPPRFSDAAFEVAGGEEKLAIRMRYLL